MSSNAVSGPDGKNVFNLIRCWQPVFWNDCPLGNYQYPMKVPTAQRLIQSVCQMHCSGRCVDSGVLLVYASLRTCDGESLSIQNSWCLHNLPVWGSVKAFVCFYWVVFFLILGLRNSLYMVLVQTQKHRSTFFCILLNTEPRNKPMQSWSSDFQQRN